MGKYVGESKMLTKSQKRYIKNKKMKLEQRGLSHKEIEQMKVYQWIYYKNPSLEDISKKRDEVATKWCEKGSKLGMVYKRRFTIQVELLGEIVKNLKLKVMKGGQI